MIVSELKPVSYAFLFRNDIKVGNRGNFNGNATENTVSILSFLFYFTILVTYLSTCVYNA